jgi:Tfp pilus assembly protein PilN
VIPARIDIDFIPQRRRLSLSGVLFLVAGAAAAIWVYDDFQNSVARSEMLDMSITRYASRSAIRTEKLPPVDAEEVVSATQQLLTPWSRLLIDLEAAAIDSEKNVALLEIAPDRNKGIVRVSGEARSLVHVLGYIERLQQADSLVSPLLENHEIQTASPERPVRFVVTASWRAQG